ncbi:lymphotoxin-beta-like isoform 1 [Lynx pardinus]|uniref:Lymphotoxin-beta-like isoform 1 n=1 Tax=Lynx pardinus TaxID=191816 RepID=A0A485PQ44_LYNPA|nr:lymphotoxin-beta-like isoform 1 [Lynx pardinus]
MGTLGLEGRGRRPQGKGCLLLAVAGATSLVTLLLAVPITVLAVLALVPQEQGGQVTGTADPGAQAQAQQRLGTQVLPEEEAGTDFSSRLPAAHLIGKDLIDSQGCSSARPNPFAPLLRGCVSDLLHHRLSLTLLPYSLLASLLEQAKPGLDLPTTAPRTPHSGAISPLSHNHCRGGTTALAPHHPPLPARAGGGRLKVPAGG